MLYSLEQFTAGRNLRPEVLSVLEELDEMYDELQFLSRDTSWINFRVYGKSDEELFKEIDANQDEIFDDISKFAVRRPQGRSSDRGVFIRYIDRPGEYLCGCWYY